jgi:hypothetical protein
MNDEEVDYVTLPEEVLTELALGGELYMATSAVTELSIRHSEAVIPITWLFLRFLKPKERKLWYICSTMPPLVSLIFSIQ